MLFHVTRAHPLVVFETEQEICRTFRLWSVELVEDECQTLKETREAKALESPLSPTDLPRLPPWPAPDNGVGLLGQTQGVY